MLCGPARVKNPVWRGTRRGGLSYRYALLSLLAIIILSAVPAGVAGPGEPEFQIEVTIDPPDSELEDDTSYDIPVNVKIVCTTVSPLMVQNSDFNHNVTIQTSSEEELPYEYNPKKTLVFPPEYCLEEKVVEYTFEVDLDVPRRYPALTQVTMEVLVTSEEGEGKGEATWESAVAFTGDISVTTLPATIMKPGTDFPHGITIRNLANAPLSGQVVRHERTHEAFDFTEVSFGPVPPGDTGHAEMEITYDHPPGGGEREKPLVFAVTVWLTDDPDQVVLEKTHTVRVEKPGGSPSAPSEAPGAPAMLPVLGLVGLLLWFRSRH